MTQTQSLLSPQDAHAMAKAIRLAERGRFTVRPNPAVGCVIVRDGVTVGEGWHQRAGTAHAEVHALRMAGEKAQGATAYVTLEPCSHHGRTPPCCDALVAAGVARVVIAMQDPNPLVSGRGIERLKAAGLAVSVGLMEASARALNAGFLSRMERGMPFVRVKVAASLDGKTALANGQSQWITSAASRTDVQYLRALSGAIVTGIDSVLLDDPSLTVRLADTADFQPIRVVLDSQLRLPLTARLLSLSGQVVVMTLATTLLAQSDKVVALQEKGVLVVAVDPHGERLDLSVVMRVLAQDFYVNDVLVEAGATLTGACVASGVVDELWWYGAPSFMGHESRSAINLPMLHSMQALSRWQLLEQRRIGPDWRVRLGRLEH